MSSSGGKFLHPKVSLPDALMDYPGTRALDGVSLDLFVGVAFDVAFVIIVSNGLNLVIGEALIVAVALDQTIVRRRLRT